MTIQIAQSTNHPFYSLIQRYAPAFQSGARVIIAHSSEPTICSGSYPEQIIVVPDGVAAVIYDSTVAHQTTLIVGAHATCRYIVTLDGLCGEQQYVCHAGASSTTRALFIGSEVAGSVQLTAMLEQPGGSVYVGVSATVSGFQIFNLRTQQIHTAPHTTSVLTVRKILFDAASATYQGMITISKEACHADAAQDDRTLLDGPLARADSVPAIEVLQDAVQCAHGSAIGRLDRELLWYFMLRGLDAQQGAALCYEAFLEEAGTKDLP